MKKESFFYRLIRPALAVALAYSGATVFGCQEQKPDLLISKADLEALWSHPSQDIENGGATLVLAEFTDGHQAGNLIVRIQRFNTEHGLLSEEQIIQTATQLLEEAFPGSEWKQVKDEGLHNQCPAFSNLCLTGRSASYQPHR